MKTYDINRNLKLYRLDKIEIQTLFNKILESFPDLKKRVSISTSIANTEISEDDFDKFWAHNEISTGFNRLYINIYTFSDESQKSISLNFHPDSTDLRVNGSSEDWVNSVDIKVVNFLNKKAKIISFVPSTVRSVLSGILLGLFFSFLSYFVTNLISGKVITDLPLWSGTIFSAILIYFLIFTKNEFSLNKVLWNRTDKLALVSIVLAVIVPLVLNIVFKEVPNSSNGISIKDEFNQSTSTKSILSKVSKSQQILNYINEQPPLQRKIFSKNYIGVYLSEKVFLTGNSLSTNDKNYSRLQFISEEGGVIFFCSINLNEYPLLKTVDSRSSFEINGKIEDVSDGYFILNECRLIF